MSSDRNPQLLSEGIAAAGLTSAGMAGVTVIAGGQEFTHPGATWKIDASNGWLAITVSFNRAVAIYREWESVRMYPSNPADLGDVATTGVGSPRRREGEQRHTQPRRQSLTAQRLDAHNSAWVSTARAFLALSWLARERRVRRKRVTPPATQSASPASPVELASAHVLPARD